jgi:glutathione synthase
VRILFVMDPLERMHPEKDTTFAFMRSSTARGHQNHHCLVNELTLVGNRAYAHAREAYVGTEPPYHAYGPGRLTGLDEFDAILIRKDPPFDRAYLYATLCLEHARGTTLIVNDPRGLRDANEKLYALNFQAWTPRTMVSSNRDEIRAFVDEVGGRAVIKPLDGAGGAGVLYLEGADRNARAVIDTLTFEGRRLAIVQAFLPAISEGDKRVLLLDGEPLGAIVRTPRADDFRANIHVGGSVHVADLAPRLRQDGLFFVGLDLIGGHLTEVNVTSPTGIQELGRLTGTHPEDRVIAWLEARVNASGGAKRATVAPRA